MDAEGRKGGEGEEAQEESDGCHPSLGHKEWVISTYLSPDEREGGMGKERETAHTGGHIYSWLLLSHSAGGELRGKSKCALFCWSPFWQDKELGSPGGRPELSLGQSQSRQQA